MSICTRLSVAFAFLALTSACAELPPYEDYSLARTALQAARDTDAPKYAPGFWQQADDFYRQAEKSYKDNEFGKARVQFNKARAFAEKAENATRLKKFQSGDVTP